MKSIFKLLFCIFIGFSTQLHGMDKQQPPKAAFNHDEEFAPLSAAIEAERRADSPAPFSENKKKVVSATSAVSAALSVDLPSKKGGITGKKISSSKAQKKGSEVDKAFDTANLRLTEVLTVFHPNIKNMRIDLKQRLTIASFTPDGLAHGKIIRIAEDIIQESLAFDHPLDGNKHANEREKKAVKESPVLRRTEPNRVIKPGGASRKGAGGVSGVIRLNQAEEMVRSGLLTPNLRNKYNVHLLKFYINTVNVELLAMSLKTRGELQAAEVNEKIDLVKAQLLSTEGTIPMTFNEALHYAITKLRERFPQNYALMLEDCRHQLNDDLQALAEPYNGEFPDVALVDIAVEKAIKRINQLNSLQTQLNRRYPHGPETVDSVFRHKTMPSFYGIYKSEGGEQLGDRTIESIVWEAQRMIDESIDDEIESKRPGCLSINGVPVPKESDKSKIGAHHATK